jgi:NitT/TauT family transport system permease protein
MSVDITAKPAKELNEAELSELTVESEIDEEKRPSVVMQVWNNLWPKVVAIGLVLLVWQLVYLSGWRPEVVFPSPFTVLGFLWDQITGLNVTEYSLYEQVGRTMRRGLVGYGFALAVGTAIGLAVVQWRFMRAGVGSLVAGMQTMPSIVWFPLAMVLFGLNETAIFFVVILGAAPSIAGGLITGVDEVPPPLLRAGKMIGARGINRYRYIVVPAAMPSYLQGLKQGWAFSWRSLLAGELLVPFDGSSSLGAALNYARTNPAGAKWMMSLMIVILVVGMIMDAVFTQIAKRVRMKRGLTGHI